MTQNSNEPREALTPGVRRSIAAGEADATVEQPSHRRELFGCPRCTQPDRAVAPRIHRLRVRIATSRGAVPLGASLSRSLRDRAVTAALPARTSA